MKATATVNTILKRDNKQSSDLSPDELFNVKAGDIFEVKGIGLEGDHRLVTFAKGYGPKAYNTTNRVRGIASTLDGIRSYYQRPLIITSWYRDPKTNKAVGGAPNSRHIAGDAVDFVVQGVSTQEVYNMCNKSHVGGLAQKPGAFVHIDNRGYDSRWAY
jgi:hypothetical protein